MVCFSVCKRWKQVSLTFLMSALSNPLLGFFIDGSGHYGVRGFTIIEPASSPSRGQPQAIDQSFRLLGEVRTGDSASFFAEFKLFDDPQNAYLGNTAQPSSCNGGSDCKNKLGTTSQSVTEPGYKWLTPKITKFYMRYAFDFCVLEAGRRPRDWGMGIFLDSGERPFSLTSSTFDGISCSINLQKFQDLGFSFGYDKLAETGVYVGNDTSAKVNPGPNSREDDIDQYFLTVEYDDRKTRPNSFFNKQIGIYAANIKSGDISGGGLNTDLSIADLFLGFYFPRVSFRNEFLFRIGNSADPNAYTLGGALYDSSGNTATNKLNAIGAAGSLEWLMSGSPLSAQPYLGIAGNRHTMFFEYAVAPGSKQGYYSDNTKDSTSAAAVSKRDTNAGAVAFNKNYSPGLILFNGRRELSDKEVDLRVDGIFDPHSVMNAQVYSLGYRLENRDYGNFESKVLTALLIQTPPEDVLPYYKGLSTKPIGYYGESLGYELDLKYWHNFSSGIEAGIAGAVLLPGLAWQTQDDQKPVTSYLLQAELVYSF